MQTRAKIITKIYFRRNINPYPANVQNMVNSY